MTYAAGTWGLKDADELLQRDGRQWRTSTDFIAPVTALPAAIRYILKAESDDRRGARRKIYRIRAGSAVSIE
jgi:hypothetical protein